MGLSSAKRVVISRNALQSIKEISDYLTQHQSVEMARYVRSAIIKRCRELGVFSNYSVESYLEDLGMGHRSVTQWDYNIIFRVTDSEVRVLDIVHTSRHPDRRRDWQGNAKGG